MSFYNNGGYYGGYPYGANYYGNNMMYQQTQNQFQAQPMMQQQQVAQNFIPMYYVQGIEGAKAYNMNPNSTILLKDSESNLLFVKTSDNQCRCTLEKYRMIKDDNNNNTSTQTENKPNFDVSSLVTKTDLEELKTTLTTLLKGGIDNNDEQ